MVEFVKETIKGNKFELLIDTSIYKKDIIFRTAYLFLDKGYFFFKNNQNKEIVVQFTLKEGADSSLQDIIKDFSNEILNNMLRTIVAKENKEIRGEIITSAIRNSLREAELPNDWKGYDENENDYFENRDNNNNDNNDDIDFDKDIDDILKEIENDPDLKIDEDEIERILKEIEDEENIEDDNTEKEVVDIKVDIEGVKKAKKKFKK